jgi:hypothetical protein
MSVFWLRQEIVFGVTYKLTVQQRRNRYSEGRDDGQMNFLNFNSYTQNQHFFVLQTDGKTDGWMEILIRGGLGSLIGFSR